MDCVSWETEEEIPTPWQTFKLPSPLNMLGGKLKKKG